MIADDRSVFNFCMIPVTLGYFDGTMQFSLKGLGIQLQPGMPYMGRKTAK